MLSFLKGGNKKAEIRSDSEEELEVENPSKAMALSGQMAVAQLAMAEQMESARIAKTVAKAAAKEAKMTAGRKYLELVTDLARKVNAGELDLLSAVGATPSPGSVVEAVFQFFDGYALIELELTCKKWHALIVASKVWRVALAGLLRQEATLARLAIDIRRNNPKPEKDNLAFKRLYFKVLSSAYDLDVNWAAVNYAKRVIKTGEEVSKLAVDFQAGIIVSSHWLSKVKKNVIRIWDMTTGQCKANIKVANKCPIGCLAVQEGLLLVSYNLGDQLSVWDAGTGAEVFTHEHAGGISCFRKKGSLLVTGCRDKTAVIWSVASPTRFEKVRTLVGHESLIDCVDCDEEFVVTGSRDQSVRIWTISDGKQVGLLTGHTNSIKTVSVCFPWVFTGAADRTMRLWDLSSTTPLLWKGTLHTAPVVDINSDFEKRLVSLGNAVTIGHDERDEVILWVWQGAGQTTGLVAGKPMIYRSKKGLPRALQEGCMAVTQTPFHLILGDVEGNIHILDFLHAGRADEAVDFNDPTKAAKPEPKVITGYKPSYTRRGTEGYKAGNEASKSVYNKYSNKYMY